MFGVPGTQLIYSKLQFLFLCCCLPIFSGINLPSSWLFFPELGVSPTPSSQQSPFQPPTAVRRYWVHPLRFPLDPSWNSELHSKKRPKEHEPMAPRRSGTRTRHVWNHFSKVCGIALEFHGWDLVLFEVGRLLWKQLQIGKLKINLYIPGDSSIVGGHQQPWKASLFCISKGSRRSQSPGTWWFKLTFLGWWKRDPFNGCLWPPTRGSKGHGLNHQVYCHLFKWVFHFFILGPESLKWSKWMDVWMGCKTRMQHLWKQIGDPKKFGEGQKQTVNCSLKLVAT